MIWLISLLSEGCNVFYSAGSVADRLQLFVSHYNGEKKMRVNVYAEELPEEGSVEIIGKNINGHVFTGLRIPLYLPVTMPDGTQVRGKFMHHPDDDDSSAITIWGKRDLRVLLREALAKLDKHYADRDPGRPVKPHRSGGGHYVGG